MSATFEARTGGGSSAEVMQGQALLENVNELR